MVQITHFCSEYPKLNARILHIKRLNLEYSTLEKHISKPRLDRYLRAAGNSKANAQKLYRANLRISQAFYPLLNLLEIALRNAINKKLASTFSNPNWIITEKAGFMSDGSLSASNYKLRGSVARAERTIKKRGRVTAGKVVAEQTFGFWCSLFDIHHYKLIGGSVISSFQNKPSPVNRGQICKKLNRIRQFRNRVYHNEPICFNSGQIDLATAKSIKLEIYEVLEWLDPKLTSYVSYFDNVDSKINSANKI
jgi:hypothetical protein